MAEIHRTDKILGFTAIGLLVVGCMYVLLPFMSALLWAVVFTFTVWPVFSRVHQWVGGRKTLAAALMTLATALIVLAPFAVVTASLADNSSALADAFRTLLANGLPQLPQWISNVPVVGPRLNAFWSSVGHDDQRLLESIKAALVSGREILLAGGGYLAAGVAQLGLSVVVAFFLFRDGDSMSKRVRAAVVRLGGLKARRLLEVAGDTITSVVYGILGTALAQGVLAGGGFLIAGVPGALLLGMATFCLSIIPVGPPLIWIPVTVWLFSQGSLGWGIFMGLWGLLVVSMVDNVLKPAIISRGTNLPFLLVLFGVLGGVFAFGFIGVFLGPTLLAVGFRVLNEWIDGDQGATPKPALA